MTDDPLLGRQLSNFKLERVLGRGGMAQVYYGVDIKLNRPVAVKVIDARFRNDPAYAKRFINEARAVAVWRHENIAQIFYADEEGGLYFFAMEYIDGQDLGQLLTKYASDGDVLPHTEVLRIGRAIASALDYAHARQVVHRDVKPSNVIVARDGRVVLTDFGLALDIQQGSVGEVFGSAHYIAPEQARRSSDAVPQSDLYSLGIILYEMLTGVVPFDDPSPTAVAIQHITQPPPSPRTVNANLNQAVEDVLLKALRKSANERYQTGAELMDALEQAIQNDSTVSHSTPLPLPPAGMPIPSQSAQPSHLNVPQQNSVSQASPQKLSPDESSPRQKKTPPTKMPTESQPARSRRQTYLWMGVGGCALVLIIITIIAGILFRGSLSSLSSATDMPSASNAPEALTLAATSSVVISSSTDTISITDTPAADTVPTVKYPDGKRFMLYFDDNSFYFYNLSDATIPINWVAFERLNDAGVALNRFNGSRWGEFYGSSEPGRCMALKILGSPSYLDPPECGKNNFLSLRTPVRNDETVFWTSMEGSHQFRVLWREGGVDEEVARCEIGVTTCEVFLP